jgi:hypothetical protein
MNSTLYHIIKKNIIVIILVFNFTSFYSQKYFSKSNLNYFDQYSISGGLLINQAIHNDLSYRPNNKALIIINTNAVTVKNLSFNIGLGLRKKALIGYGNYSWLKLFNNFGPSSNHFYERYFKHEFLYFNLEALFKITFLQKYKLQPFLFIGPRFNKIINQSDSLDYYNKYYNTKFKTRDNYINSFYGLGLNYYINTCFVVNIAFERNEDMIPYRQAYFNNNSSIASQEIRFISYSFQLGLTYTIKKPSILQKKALVIE